MTEVTHTTDFFSQQVDRLLNHADGRTIWEFILKNEADCIFYIRYYYSADCRAQAYDTHLKHFHALIEKVRPAFKPGTNVDMLVHQIFNTMLAFATRVLNGEMENSEATTQWTFEQIYSFVVPNVRAEFLEEEDKKKRYEQISQKNLECDQ